MTTVQQLIEALQKIEDKELVVLATCVDWPGILQIELPIPVPGTALINNKETSVLFLETNTNGI